MACEQSGKTKGKSGKGKFGVVAILFLLAGCAANAQQSPAGLYAINSTSTGNAFFISQPNIAGNTTFVIWSAIDNGSGTYDWSSVESSIAPWWAAGKKTGLIVWAMADSSSIVATPAYVLAQLPATISCTGENGGGMQNVPEFTAPAFQTAYITFLKAFFGKYGSDPRIAYIRVGLGGGGETYPSCTAAQQQSYGLTQAKWQTYVDTMLGDEQTMTGTVPVMVALNCYGTPCPASNPYGFPQAVAAIAVQYGFGIGQESLQKSSITAYQAGQPCVVNWCAFFAQYPNILHELQFAEPTCADNTCAVGSPTVLLPFAAARGARIVEITTTDLDIAYGKTTGNYTAAYQQAISGFAAAIPGKPPAATALTATTK